MSSNARANQEPNANRGRAVPRGEEMGEIVAVYPGSFDPMTNGHVDIIQRGSRFFDRIVIAVLVNVEKSPLFTAAERVDIAREVFTDWPNVEVDTFHGLLVDYVRSKHASVIVRGLRAVSDFEYEFQMALMNRTLWPEAETVFLAPDARYSFLSASLVREIASLGGDISDFVAPSVLQRLQAKSAKAK